MFRRILVPLDGSENAERALPWVRKYAAGSGASVVLIQALARVYPLKGLPFGALEREASTYLDQVRKGLLSEGIPAKVSLPQNPAAESIVKAAVREGCDVIVMTTRGASKVVRWLVGGVTEQVMRLSPIPVIVVRSQAPERIGPQPRRILAPQDGSVHAKRALPWVERLARFHEAPVEILHVEPKLPRPFRRAAASRGLVSPKLAHWCSLLRRRGVAATYRLSQGDPASEILRNTLPTDLLVLTTHGYGGLKHLLMGSVAEKVIHGTETPVFIFKHRLEPPPTGGDGRSGRKSSRTADSRD